MVAHGVPISPKYGTVGSPVNSIPYIYMYKTLLPLGHTFL